MSSYGQPGFTAEYGTDPGKFGPFGIELTDNRSEPRDDWNEDYGSEFELSMPHQCDEWSIAAGDRDHVIAAARRFRTELDAAISELEQISQS